MTDILVSVSCKFEMYIFKFALVISENVRIAFLYVLSIYIILLYCELSLINACYCWEDATINSLRLRRRE